MRKHHALPALLALPLAACLNPSAIAEPHPGAFNPAANSARIDENSAAIGREVRETESRIDRQRDAGTLSRRDARKARRANSLIASMARQYGSDGTMTDSERRELEIRSRDLQTQVDLAALTGNQPEERKKKRR